MRWVFGATGSVVNAWWAGFHAQITPFDRVLGKL
jgi:hypothetical protein